MTCFHCKGEMTDPALRFGHFICRACCSMIEALASPYWHKLHVQWAAEEARHEKRIKRLRPGAEYLD